MMVRPIHLITACLLLSASFALAQPHVQVITPNGGENWQKNVSHAIHWSCNIPGNVSIQLYRHAGNQDDFCQVISPSSGNGGSYSWTPGSTVPTGDNFRIRVNTLNDTLPAYDFSDGNFSIFVPPQVTLTSPNGGENWQVGSTHNVTWTDIISGNFAIDLYRGADLESSIATAAPNTGSFVWHVPADIAPGTTFKVSIRSLSDSSVLDWSDTTFALSPPPSIDLTAPNGGETLYAGDTTLITWTSVSMASEGIHIDLKRDYPASSWVMLASSVPNTGSFAWIVTGPATTTARVRVVGVSHVAVSDTSDASFSILDDIPSPTLTISPVEDHGRLMWRRVSGAVSYRVWHAPAVEGPYDLLTTTPDTTCRVETNPSLRQYYRVTAVH